MTAYESLVDFLRVIRESQAEEGTKAPVASEASDILDGIDPVALDLLFPEREDDGT